jgi:D-amino-acid oxidase
MGPSPTVECHRSASKRTLCRPQPPTISHLGHVRSDNSPRIRSSWMNHSSREPIAIVGGGVSGITTALILQLHGYKTVLYTRDIPSGLASQAWDLPEFASLHAAASILPHSVRSSRLSAWMRRSQAVFRTLAYRADAGVRKQRHYELFEASEVKPPTYRATVDNFCALSADATRLTSTPRRPGAHEVVGWHFDAYFCEAPTYLNYLYRFYRAEGGAVRLTSGLGIEGFLVDYLRQGHMVVVNCTGKGTDRLLDSLQLSVVRDRPDADFEPLLDSCAQRIVRGHYLRVLIDQPLQDASGQFLSYNYTPHPSIYPGLGGSAADVYCYPRSDGWVLGGSRQVRTAGSTDRSRWLGADAGYEVDQFIRPDGVSMEVPAPIFTLNSELIASITSDTIRLDRLRAERPSAFAAAVGYRFERDSPENSVRLSCSRVELDGSTATIVHNYGHGGAGFTLSWGCAIDVLAAVEGLAADDWSQRSRQGPSADVRPGSMKASLLELSQHLLNSGTQEESS